MHLNDAASWVLVVFGAIFALTTVGLLGALAFALSKLQQQITKLTDKVDPVIAKASSTLDSVQRVTVMVGDKADQILTRGEALTEDVSQKVENTASVVQNAVTTPLINLSSLIAGVSRGFSTWNHPDGGAARANGRAKAAAGRAGNASD